jgi:hypothetical protein
MRSLGTQEGYFRMASELRRTRIRQAYIEVFKTLPSKYSRQRELE